MSAKNKHRSWAAYHNTTTFGGDEYTDWAATGVTLEHTALDVTTIKPARLDDPTLERDVMAFNTRHKIAGLRNAEAKLTIKLHGKGVTTAEDVQVTTTPLADTIKHCMGGMHRSNTTSITGGTASAPIVDEVTNIVPGCTIWVEDKTTPAAKYAGKPRMTRVIAVDAGTKTLTVKPELPFTPAEGDAVYGTITLYIDEDVLEDAVSSAGGPHTRDWFFKKHATNGDLLWKLDGCVASMTLQGLGSGQLPTIDLAIMAANCRIGAADGLTNPDFAAAPYGHAQLCIGKDSETVIAKYSGDDHTVQKTSEFAFDVGYTRDRINADSIPDYRMENTSTYGVEPGNTSATITVNDYIDDWYADQELQDEWYVLKMQPAAQGKCWAIMIPRAQIVEHPPPKEVGSIHGITVKFGAMVPDDATGGANKRMKESRFLISLC